MKKPERRSLCKDNAAVLSISLEAAMSGLASARAGSSSDPGALFLFSPLIEPFITVVMSYSVTVW